MLGQWNLLSLLKGWEYKLHTFKRPLQRGETKEISIREVGWLVNLMELTDDAYGSFTMNWQGADLEIKEYSWYPEAALDLGAVAQDPAGWLQLYYRPNPASTLGAYVVVAFSGGTQGAIWPYIPTIKIILELMNESTQPSATVSVRAVTVAITNYKMFITSLKRLLSSRSSKVIDKGLQSPEAGPAVKFEDLSELLEQIEREEKGR